MTRPVIIDLCKIGFISWGIVSGFLVFCFVCEESAYISIYHTYIFHDETYHIYNECYKGILDSGEQCFFVGYHMSDFFLNNLIIFLCVNIFNWYLWFVAINRKYKWYSFEFRSCNY